MNASSPERLRQPLALGPLVEALAATREAWFWTDREALPRSQFAHAPWLHPLQEAARDRAVLVRTRDQLGAALALMALDGVARRMVLCPPGFDPAHLQGVIADAQLELEITDGPGQLRLTASDPPLRSGGGGPREAGWRGRDVSGDADHEPPKPLDAIATEWVLFTSGTSGPPKMVRHTLAGLTGAITPTQHDEQVVWGTFYDIRRYGGLQILLRALVGGVSLVLSAAEEPTAAFLERLGARGATHVTGTPTHWRQALMSPALRHIAPRYVRLSGEIADQAVLDALRAAFPEAVVAHAFASTEAGVAFEVRDGRAGFPAALVDDAEAAVQMQVVDGSLRIRSNRTALAYVGPADAPLSDEEGFVDTGDMLTLDASLAGGRYSFAGRRGGIINVGGLKIHPEEVEAVINRHPAVRLSLVKGRRNAVTGTIVVAEVVLTHAVSPEESAAVKAAILDTCRAVLPPFKTPATIRIVDAVAMTAGGKLERSLA